MGVVTQKTEQTEWVWHKGKVWQVLWTDKSGIQLRDAQDHSLGITCRPEETKPINEETRKAIKYFTGE